MSSNPPFVGITGGIGSGKTTVCKIFEVLGSKTYYADDRAKELMETNTELVNQIKELFGEQAYANQKLDRKFIAERAFKNDELLQKLNGLVHPAVAKDVKEWFKRNIGRALLLKEAALLFEAGSYKSLSKNVLVTAPKEVRIARVLKRDPHRTEEDVTAIMKKQFSDDEKIALADYVIRNDGSESVIRQVMSIYHDLVVT